MGNLESTLTLIESTANLPPVTGPENKKDNNDAEEDEDGHNGADLSSGESGRAKFLEFLDLPKFTLLVVALHSNCVEVEHLASLVLDEVEQGSRLTGAVVRVPASC